MCGIAGIISFGNNAVEKPVLKTMTDAIAHRGPDGEGHWISPDSRAGLGHRRLSIIDLSDAASQPMKHHAGRYTITFNGEIYNYLELKKLLESRGVQFNTASDTEVLLELFIYYGYKCLDLLDGMFAFAIWDNEEKKLFAARDRFGEKPFFYTMDAGRFLFASEMKSLFAAGCRKKVSAKRLHYYLAYNLQQDPNDASSTYYEGIYQLPPAHYITLGSNGKVQAQRYWKIDTAKENRISMDAAIEEFDALLRRSISRRLRSDVPVGSSLSGGLDSSTIVLLIESMKAAGHKQKTFSARFADFEKDEGNYIKEVLRKASSAEGFEVWPDRDIMNELDLIWHHQEEPFGSASIVAQWSVMRLAKQNDVTVLLDGQGADEILGGYRTFFQPYLNKLYAAHDVRFAQERDALRANQNFDYNISARGRKMLRHPHFYGLLSSVRNIVPRKKKVLSKGFYHDDFYGVIKDFQNPFEGEENTDVKKLQERIIERAGFVPLLRYADRNSMAHSREIRLPFLSHELVEFCISLPDELKVNQGWTKILLRNTYRNLLPEMICWRKDKVGFAAPQEEWLKLDAAKEMVADARQNLYRSGIIAPGQMIDDWKALMAARLYKTDNSL